MNNAIARPRATGVLYRSANMPPTMDMGEQAKKPAMNRKKRKPVQVGENGVATVNMKNSTNVDI